MEAQQMRDRLMLRSIIWLDIPHLAAAIGTGNNAVENSFQHCAMRVNNQQGCLLIHVGGWSD